MAIKGDRNIQEIYNDYNVINSYIFLYTWFLYHNETSAHGHEIFKFSPRCWCLPYYMVSHLRVSYSSILALEMCGK